MEKQLNKEKVAVMATNGVEQSEFKKPIKALKNEVILKSGKNGKATPRKLAIAIGISEAKKNG